MVSTYESASKVIRFDRSVMKTGPIYREGQLVCMPHFLPLDNMSTWCRMDGNLRIQLGQRIIETPIDSWEDRCFTKLFRGETETQMPGEWYDIPFDRVNYSMNLSRASVVLVSNNQMQVFQQPGAFVVGSTQAAEIGLKLKEDDSWLGPYPLLEYSDNVVGYIHLDEIDRLTFIGETVLVFTHGKSQEIALIDADGDLKFRTTTTSGWLPINDKERVNIACAAYYAMGPSDCSQTTKHNRRGLHFGSDKLVYLNSIDELGRDNDAILTAATHHWIPIVFDNHNGENRYNPRRIEVLYLDDLSDPKHFILLSEGRYHFHGPLTAAVNMLYTSFTVVNIY
jgi:hypothetical protein